MQVKKGSCRALNCFYAFFILSLCSIPSPLPLYLAEKIKCHFGFRLSRFALAISFQWTIRFLPLLLFCCLLNISWHKIQKEKGETEKKGLTFSFAADLRWWMITWLNYNWLHSDDINYRLFSMCEGLAERFLYVGSPSLKRLLNHCPWKALTCWDLKVLKNVFKVLRQNEN